MITQLIFSDIDIYSYSSSRLIHLFQRFTIAILGTMASADSTPEPERVRRQSGRIAAQDVNKATENDNARNAAATVLPRKSRPRRRSLQLLPGRARAARRRLQTSRLLSKKRSASPQLRTWREKPTSKTISRDILRPRRASPTTRRRSLSRPRQRVARRTPRRRRQRPLPRRSRRRPHLPRQLRPPPHLYLLRSTTTASPTTSPKPSAPPCNPTSPSSSL